MSFLSDLEKTLRTNHILVILGAIVLVYAVYTYSDQKFVAPYEPLRSDGNSRQKAPIVQVTQQPVPLAADASAVPPPSGGANLPVANPADLLPRDSNNQWGSLNPAGSGDLQGQNLLSATFLTGIDTIGNTMKRTPLELGSHQSQ